VHCIPASECCRSAARQLQTKRRGGSSAAQLGCALLHVLTAENVQPSYTVTCKLYNTEACMQGLDAGQQQ